MSNTDSLAEITRQIAHRVDNLRNDIVASFQHDDPSQRVAFLQGIAIGILHDFAPVMSWLERNRPLENAKAVRDRLWSILEEAKQCAGMEIPHLAGGKISRSEDELTEGARRGAELIVVANRFAVSLLGLADDIEAESNTGFLTSTQLAKKHRVNAEALRKRLERWKRTHPDDWQEVANRRSKEAQYLFRESAVLPIIKKLKASGKRPAK
jgi:hypothetical protein